MCIPHAPKKTFKADRRERKSQPKSFAPFNKELLKPDPDFTDERKHSYIPQGKPQSLLEKFFSLIR